jgi:hypothetical protein
MLNHDRTAFKAHLKGLRQMIAMRGGIDSLQHESVMLAGYLRLVIEVSDNEESSLMSFSYEYVIASMASEFEGDEDDWPGKSAIGLSPHLHAMVFPASAGIFTLERTFIDPTVHGFSENTVLFLESLCDHLCISDVFINRDRSAGQPKKPLEILIPELLSLDYEVLLNPGSSLFANYDPKSTVDHVLQALITTTIIQFQYLHPSCPFTRLQKIAKLKYHLSKTPIQTYWKPIPGALLWCFLVGVVASRNCTERPWFLANMIRGTCGIAFENLDGLRVALDTFNRLAKQQDKIVRELGCQ